MEKPDRKPTVCLSGIVKRFGDIAANDRINLTAYSGEIHALLGENGAGKSTLMNILAGVYTPDGGTISLHGRPVSFRTPRDAIRSGIGMVHQHFAQVPGLSVAQNIGLSDPDSPFLINPALLEKKVSDLCDEYGFGLDPRAIVAELSVGERQKLELLRLLSKQADIIILDEPTAVLTPGEADDLFHTLRSLAKRGETIIFITHKLHEVETWADRISVLRKGKMRAEGLLREQWDEHDIISLMICSEKISGAGSFKSKGQEASQEDRAGSVTVFELLDGYALADDGTRALCNVSLRVKPGEIVAVAGVAGNGQHELAEVALGLRPLQSGILKIDEEVATDWLPYETRKSGVGFVPEDRMIFGICPDLSLEDNLNLNLFASRLPFFPDQKELESNARALADSMDIHKSSMDDPVSSLSGGNIQRAILAREIDAATRLLIVAQPTRGLDVAATMHVRRTLAHLKRSGIGILLISYDLDEIYRLADRIAVMFKGKVTAFFDPPFPVKDVIGMAMAGGGCDND